ncbi:oxalate:formate antiporter [Echinococcus granulosus]|uniref:Oxalate:formate antiporter n=1 Tax=Echinococcus granulosus TaxID=6210 RepID=W6U5H6_ECHGR|nr:oxalate:formate antiporter [Echinococcus granulosus]EUB55821.1 oxalate:formate antiporter [Echinococcus granulosus]
MNIITSQDCDCKRYESPYDTKWHLLVLEVIPPSSFCPDGFTEAYFNIFIKHLQFFSSSGLLLLQLTSNNRLKASHGFNNAWRGIGASCSVLHAVATAVRYLSFTKSYFVKIAILPTIIIGSIASGLGLGALVLVPIQTAFINPNNLHNFTQYASIFSSPEVGANYPKACSVLSKFFPCLQIIGLALPREKQSDTTTSKKVFLLFRSNFSLRRLRLAKYSYSKPEFAIECVSCKMELLFAALLGIYTSSQEFLLGIGLFCFKTDGKQMVCKSISLNKLYTWFSSPFTLRKSSKRIKLQGVLNFIKTAIHLKMRRIFVIFHSLCELMHPKKHLQILTSKYKKVNIHRWLNSGSTYLPHHDNGLSVKRQNAVHPFATDTKALKLAFVVEAEFARINISCRKMKMKMKIYHGYAFTVASSESPHASSSMGRQRKERLAFSKHKSQNANKTAEAVCCKCVFKNYDRTHTLVIFAIQSSECFPPVHAIMFHSTAFCFILLRFDLI